MAEYKHGQMDVRDQERTFEGFLKFMTWGAILSILALIFVALVNG